MLTTELANQLVELPLDSILREYPNVIVHVMNGPEMISPRQIHPVFYGCFDWHSSVHSHWALVCLLRRTQLRREEETRRALRQNLTPENIQGEVRYLSAPGRKSFERMYGWAWLLKLADELLDWDDEDGMAWGEALAPLRDLIVDRYLEFLPKQTYPIRLGTHTNTAFGLTFAWDYARKAGVGKLEKMILQRALGYYGKDENISTAHEPGGADFLSPSLIEADLMRRVLAGDEFIAWFDRFLPRVTPMHHLLTPAEVSDRADPQIVHLDGLNLSRAWCMRGIASALPEGDFRSLIFRAAADRHQAASLPYVGTGFYEGDHWLASFAIHMLLEGEAAG